MAFAEEKIPWASFRWDAGCHINKTLIKSIIEQLNPAFDCNKNIGRVQVYYLYSLFVKIRYGFGGLAENF